MKHCPLPIFLSLSLVASASLSSWASPTVKKAPLSLIVGKWRVISGNPGDIKNHSYEFLANGTCIEKYQSEQTAGSIDAPPELVWMDVITSHRYKVLGKNRYRLEAVKSLINGSDPAWEQEARIIEATIVKNKARVTVVERRVIGPDKVFEQAFRGMDLEKMNGQKGKVATWVRIPITSKKLK